MPLLRFRPLPEWAAGGRGPSAHSAGASLPGVIMAWGRFRSWCRGRNRGAVGTRPLEVVWPRDRGRANRDGRAPGVPRISVPEKHCARKPLCERISVRENLCARTPWGSPFVWPRNRSVRRISLPAKHRAPTHSPAKAETPQTSAAAGPSGGRDRGLGVQTGRGPTDRSGRRSGRCSARQSQSCWRGRGGPGPRGPCWERSRGRSRDRGFRN